MLIFLVWLQLVIFSLVLGSICCSGQQIKILIYHLSPGSVAYTFGVTHRQFDAVGVGGSTRWLIDRITIGFILVAIEWEFYKRQEEEGDDIQNAPTPGA
jgi:hypothetical protein